MKFDKEDMRYFWMDHKKKLIPAIFVAAIVLLFIIVTVFSSLNKKEEPVIEEPEVIEEEIHVDGINVKTEKERLAEEIAQEKDETYGLIYQIGDILFEDDDMYFVRLSRSDGDHVVIFSDKDMFDELAKVKEGTTLRGFFEQLPKSEADNLTEKYKKLVLDEFAANKKYKKDWESSLSDGKVSHDYKKNEKRENIADDDWDLILEYAYDDFENKLIEKENSEYTAYMEENPIYDFSQGNVMTGDWNICDKNGEIVQPYSSSGLNSYFISYWNSKIPSTEEKLWESGRSVCPKDISSGAFYSDVYDDAELLFINNTGDFIILWWLDSEYNTHEEYLWPNNITRNEKNLGNSKVTNSAKIPAGVICFTYYYLGGKYDISQYLGGPQESVTLKLSNYYESTDTVDMPENIYYIYNDTKYNLWIWLDGNRFEMYSGNTLFVEGNTYSHIQVKPKE